MSSDKFNYLLIGVKEYLESKQRYPYPDLLHQGDERFISRNQENCDFS